MIPGLPNPYVLLAAVGLWLASLIGAALWYGGVVETRWEAAVATQKAEAAATLTALTEAARKKETEDAENARNIDATHAAALAAAAAGRDEFERRLRVERRRSGSCGTPASGPVDPGVGADAAAGGEPGFREFNNRRALELRDAALELQAYAKSCHAFALSVGR